MTAASSPGHPQPFLWTVSGLFWITGVLKLLSLQSDSPLLATVDEATGLTMKALFLIAGVFEIAAAAMLLAPFRPLLRCYTLRVALAFIVGYRVLAAMVLANEYWIRKLAPPTPHAPGLARTGHDPVA